MLSRTRPPGWRRKTQPSGLSFSARRQYTARGFKTLWQRSVTAALEEKVIRPEDRFTFHDLRAYYATVFKERTGELPDLHKDPGTTARIYDRNKVVNRSSL